MKREISLNGIWDLFYADVCDREPLALREITHGHLPSVKATVPGNVELDLAKGGVIPEDIFRGMNTEKIARQIETWDFVYRTEFATPALSADETPYLCFDGIDCFATVTLNGQIIGTPKNAFMPHRFCVKGLLNPAGKNVLWVQLRSTLIEGFSHQPTQQMLNAWHIAGSQYQRKPAHSYGWDIFPRAVSAGLWKDVYLSVETKYEIESVSYYCTEGEQGAMNLRVFFDLKAPMRAYLDRKLAVRVKGVCGDSAFEKTQAIDFRSGRVEIGVENAKRWWPYGYGEANIYDTTFELLCDGETVASRKFNVGFRTVKLDRTESMDEPNPRFQFIVNGVKVMCRGSNWVPLDAYHSRDKERYAKALELVSDIGCNILRVWGGGVYEQDCFYDYCDRHGIMVWQDFMMACQIYDMEAELLANMKAEFTWAIQALRNHPSIILWAGDNEIDAAFSSGGNNPETNVITRKLLPELIARHDPTRPYLPSSPYIPGSRFAEYKKNRNLLVEQHLWGARDYFKADFYKNSTAFFASETGYHGCPNRESVEKMVDAKAVWPCWNEQWTLHSSDQHQNPARVHLMDDQITQLFGFRAENLDDFILASQISQAEAKKYFIERIRIGKPQGKSGIIWWNLLDGWPQMSDAVVDYYYSKKLAYSYIKRAQAPFALMMDEMSDWCYPLVATNDTLETVSGTYTVSDLMSGKVYASGAFTVAPNANSTLARIRMMYSEKTMLLLKWEINGKAYYNHYLCGMPAFDFETYRVWLKKLQETVGE